MGTSRRAIIAAGIAVGLVLGAMSMPASAAGRIGRPWVTAASPTSITLDWPGKASGGYRISYAKTSKAVSKKSARSKKRKASRVTITGLRPDTMYCFQVARANGSGRSRHYCHPTMKHTNKHAAKAGSTRLGVMTFNVCSRARNCRGWAGRETAVVGRILDARADVVNLQEMHGRVAPLIKRLRPYGYKLAAASTSEAVFYRTSRLAAVRHVTEDCHWQILIRFPEEVPGWRKGTIHRVAGVTWKFVYEAKVWKGRQSYCSAPKEANLGGEVKLHKNATAAWATLRVKATGKRYTFVSAHLLHGKTAEASRKRGIETSRLVKRMKRLAKGTRVVYAGDVNSHRSRPHDSPRVQFSKVGYHDAYDRTSSLKKAYLSSFNGYERTPRRGSTYGEQIDRIFITDAMGASNWRVVAPTRHGRNLSPMASDHYPVRVTVWLP